jgi:large subunit ribosomal protein L18
MRIKTRETGVSDQIPDPEAGAGRPGSPRLTVFRSLSHIYVQVIDDMTGKTVASAGDE